MFAAQIQGLDTLEPAWEIAHVNAIVTCDSRNRVVVRDAVPGQKYLVKGLTLESVREQAPTKPRKWAGSKRSLRQVRDEMLALGFQFEPSMNQEVGPCQF